MTKRRRGYTNMPSNPYDKTRRMRISIRGSIEKEITRIAEEKKWSVSRTFSYLVLKGMEHAKQEPQAIEEGSPEVSRSQAHPAGVGCEAHADAR